MSWHKRQWAELIGGLGAAALTAASAGAFGPAAASALGAGSAGAGAATAGAGGTGLTTLLGEGGAASAADAGATGAGWGSLLGGAATKAATGLGTDMGKSLLLGQPSQDVTMYGQVPQPIQQQDPFSLMNSIKQKKGGF